MGQPQVESAVLAISDVHIGKQTPGYSLSVAKKILEATATKITTIIDYLRPEYSFDEFVFLFLGDILDGADIYPAQATKQDIPNVNAQAIAAAHLFLPLVEAALHVAPTVRLVGVAGNHGRSGKNVSEAANWDIVAYQQLAALCQAKWPDKVTFDFPIPVYDENAIVKETATFWLKVTKIKNHYFLLHHGHRARSVMGVPYYSIRTRALTWRSALPQRWKVLLHGHFHQFGRIDFNDIIILLNGTAVLNDTWALENFGLQGINRWWFFGVSTKFPLTWQFALNVNL